MHPLHSPDDNDTPPGRQHLPPRRPLVPPRRGRWTTARVTFAGVCVALAVVVALAPAWQLKLGAAAILVLLISFAVLMRGSGDHGRR
ncbi:hypothetical protein [Sphaerisporangium aureirubrum]|uniref:DUF3040 domain-containing protein n=1 Tax=Sphaerisporangium aureirubrum TaxID=1544736 RepID=A0ABW1NSP2_9ACTN